MRNLSILLVLYLSSQALSLRISDPFRPQSQPEDFIRSPLCNPVRDLIDQRNGLPRNNEVPQCSSSVEEIVSGQMLPGLASRSKIAPKWINQTLYTIGQQFAKKNLEIVFFTNFMASLFLASEKDAADLLAFTGSDQLNLGIPRYLLTMKLLTILLNNNLSSEIGGVVVTKIRRIFKNVGYQADTKLAKGCSLNRYNAFTNKSFDSALWEAFETDLQASKIENRKYSENYRFYRHSASPVNQFRLAEIQFFLVGLPFVAPNIHKMMNPTEEDLTGWIHMWAVLGNAIGIDDAFNVALQPSLADAKVYFQMFYKTYTIQNLFHLSKESKILMEMLLQAGRNLPPNDYLGSDLLLLIFLEDFLQVDAPRTKMMLDSSGVRKLDWWRNLNTFFSSFPRTSKQLMILVNNDFDNKFNRDWRRWFGAQFMSDLHIAMYTFV